MPIQTWPTSIPGSGRRVLRDGFERRPPSNIRTSETDQSVRRRRISTARKQQDQLTIRMTYAEFDVFENWVINQLRDGVRSFIWQPPRRSYQCLSNFVENDGRPYIAQPIQGQNMNVTLTIEYFDREYNA